MERQSIALVGNGALQRSFIPLITSHSLIVGIDRAAFWLIEQGIMPHVAIGDFDSTSVGEFTEIQKNIQMTV
jgi:thiamine pyrophosphokinase